MANIKNSEYRILGTTEANDTIEHFETNSQMTRILDANKNVVGNLEEALIIGKTVSNVNWKTLKIKGKYRITGIQGVTGVTIDVNKTHVLSVDPVGPVGNPNFVVYTLYAPTGEIYSNTVVGTAESGWTAGGSLVKTQIDNVNSRVTTVNNSLTALSTKVTSVSTVANGVRQDLETYKSHTHPEYLPKAGGAMTGELTISNNTNINMNSSRNESRQVLKVSNTDLLSIGNTAYVLNLLGNGDFKYNNKKVWTEVNHGVGSGLDADLLGGKSYSLYPTTDKSVTFNGSGTFNGNLKANLLQLSTNAKISAVSNGRITFKAGTGANEINMETNGRLRMMSEVIFNGKNNQVGLRLALSDSEEGKGMGMYRNVTSKYLGFYDWNKDQRLAYFDPDTSGLFLDKPLSITGRKLYLQSGTPVGVHKAGDIWIK